MAVMRPDVYKRQVHAGEVVALAGLVGAGRTEIARCLFGADRRSAGEILFDGALFAPRSPFEAIKAGIGFVTEDRKEQGVLLALTVREKDVYKRQLRRRLLRRLTALLPMGILIIS